MAKGRECALLFAKRAHEAFPQAQVWLYGSYAKGSATAASDIDIAVIFPAGTSKQMRYLPLQMLIDGMANDIDCMIEPAAYEFGDPMAFVETEVIPKGMRLA